MWWWVTILLQLLVVAFDGDNAARLFANSTGDRSWLCHARLGGERIAIECALEGDITTMVSSSTSSNTSLANVANVTNFVAL